MGLVCDINDIGVIVFKEVNGMLLMICDVVEVKIGMVVCVGVVVKNGVMEFVGGVVMMMCGGNVKEVVVCI